MKSKWRPYFFNSVLILGLVAIGLWMGALAGNRFEWMEYRDALGLFQGAVWLSLITTGLAMIGLVIGRRSTSLALVLLICSSIGASGVIMQAQAENTPTIHDVSTDTENPPLFKAVRRTPEMNSLEYGGEEVANQQRQAYPDIQPLESPLSADAVYARALESARQMGWEIVAEDSLDGRIEATATSTFFGFRYDLAIRVQPREGGGTRVDVRSVSRVGKGDLGANADLIRSYLSRL